MTMQQDTREMQMVATPDGYICVEFFGLPGSGKTTIAREVHGILSRTRPGLMFAPELLRDEAGGAVRAAAKLRLILSTVFRDSAVLADAKRASVVQQARLSDKVRAVFTIATVAALYAKIQRKRLGAVLDQGALQALWSLQLRATGGNGGTLVTEMLKVAAFSGRVHVSVETPPEVCFERLGTRTSKHSRMQTSGSVTDQSAWETAELLRRTILGNLLAAYRKQVISPQIITVDGTLDPADAARQVVADLKRSKLHHVLTPSEQLREVMQ